MLINTSGNNVYVGDKLVGCVKHNTIYINGKQFAKISDDGIISYDNKEIGYIDEDDGTIFINKKEAGYMDTNNNIIFYKL